MKLNGNKHKTKKIAIILAKKLAKDLPEITRGCRMHDTTTTMIVAAIANRVAIMALINSTMQ